jgi:hypothetical protein
VIKVTKDNLSTLQDGYTFIMKAKGHIYLLKCLELLERDSYQWIQLSTFAVWDTKNNRDECLIQAINDDRCKVYAYRFSTFESKILEAFK